MKIFYIPNHLYLISLFVLTNLCAYAQKGDLPQMVINTTDQDCEESLVFQQLHHKYKEVIAYTQYSTGMSVYRNQYIVLVHENDQWQLFRWDEEYEDDPVAKLLEATSDPVHVSQDKIDSLIDFWVKNDFFTITFDSLNFSTVLDGPNKGVMIGIQDGWGDTFELITNNEYRRVSAYMAHGLQQHVFIYQRKIFLACFNEFIRLFGK